MHPNSTPAHDVTATSSKQQQQQQQQGDLESAIVGIKPEIESSDSLPSPTAPPKPASHAHGHGRGHSFRSGGDDHGHGAPEVEKEDDDDGEGHETDPRLVIAQLIGVAILEFGIVLHSVIIGLTLAVDDSFRTLFVVLIFHRKYHCQFFFLAILSSAFEVRKF